MARMRDTTPYHERPPGEVERERHCMARILEHARDVDTVFEAFSGMGVTSQVLHSRFPRAMMWGCDLDKTCADTFNRKFNPPHFCQHGDVMDVLPQLDLRPPWGASLDFNRFTLLDLRTSRTPWKRKLVEQVVDRRPRWVQITDSAVGHLHLNWGNYGLVGSSLMLYVMALSSELSPLGLRLVGYQWHSRATYLLYTTKEK